MSDHLFRPQALAAAAETNRGSAVLHQPLSLKCMSLALVLVFAGFMIFAALAEVSDTERVVGSLRPVAGSIQLRSPRDARVQEIAIAEQEAVRAGQVLLTLRNPLSDQRGRQSVVLIRRRLDQQIAALEGRRALLGQRLLLERRQLSERLDRLEEELALLQRQQRLVDRRRELGRRRHDRIRQLFDGGAVAPAARDRAAERWYEARQISNDNRLEIRAQRSRIRAVEQELARLPLEIGDQRLSLTGSLARLRARKQEMASDAVFTLTAPTDGMVTNVLASRGGHVDRGAPVATIVPGDYRLEALLYVPSRAIGQVREGQMIRVQYAAYPHEIYGTYEAEVERVAATVVDPREVSLPFEFREPVYRVRARLARQRIGQGNGERLRPGMRLEAEIVTASESLLQRLMAPLTRLGRNL